MREQLKQYIDHLFLATDGSQKASDFHDEILQNTLDRYDEELSSGKSEQEAYRIAVLSLGNTEELLRPYYPKHENTGVLRAIGIVLYCTCFIPVIFCGVANILPSTLGVTLMFLMIGVATCLIILSQRSHPSRGGKQAQILRAIGVGLIVSSVGALLFGAGYDQIRMWRLLPVGGAVLGLCAMFLMIAAGIALLVLAGQKKREATIPVVPKEPDPYASFNPAEPQRSAQQAAPSRQPVAMEPAIPKGLRIAAGIITAIYWISVVFFYINISVTTGAWLFTWLIFVAASGVYDIAKSIVLLCCGLPWLARLLNGLISLAACIVYYYLTASTGLWLITWLVFVIAACVNGAVSGIIALVKSSVKEAIS